jgi:hypothetical protein
MCYDQALKDGIRLKVSGSLTYRCRFPQGGIKVRPYSKAYTNPRTPHWAN